MSIKHAKEAQAALREGWQCAVLVLAAPGRIVIHFVFARRPTAVRDNGSGASRKNREPVVRGLAGMQRRTARSATRRHGLARPRWHQPGLGKGHVGRIYQAASACFLQPRARARGAGQQ